MWIAFRLACWGPSAFAAESGVGPRLDNSQEAYSTLSRPVSARPLGKNSAPFLSLAIPRTVRFDMGHAQVRLLKRFLASGAVRRQVKWAA